jgi:hypothetical protein
MTARPRRSPAGTNHAGAEAEKSTRSATCPKTIRKVQKPAPSIAALPEALPELSSAFTHTFPQYLYAIAASCGAFEGFANPYDIESTLKTGTFLVWD